MGPYLRRSTLLASWFVGALVGGVALRALGFGSWPLVVAGASGIGLGVVLLAVVLWATSDRDGGAAGEGPERPPRVN